MKAAIRGYFMDLPCFAPIALLVIGLRGIVGYLASSSNSDNLKRTLRM